MPARIRERTPQSAWHAAQSLPAKRRNRPGRSRRIDHQALNRRLLQHIDAGFARGVFQLHDAQLALFVGKTRIQQRQREAAVRRRQGKNHDLGAVVQIARKRGAATVTVLGKLLSQSRSSKAGAAIAKRY